MAALSLLQKCEEFLLHPTVRSLSLAQRVDFLEKKGLSPEEITQCLKSVERRNGLSQLAQRTVDDLAASADTRSLNASESAAGAAKSPLQLLKFIVKKYGVVTLLLVLLGYGYVQFRRRKTEQLLLTHEAAKVQRKKRMHSRVEALLAVVKDQQKQYNQAAELLNARVAKYLAARQAATNQVTASKANSSMTQITRGLELQALQSELMELKSAVVNTYLHPPIAKKTLERKKELPIVLRPAEVPVTKRLALDVQDIAVASDQAESSKTIEVDGTSKGQQMAQTVACSRQKHKRVQAARQSDIRDQTTMSSEEIAELFERGQVEEELSTAGSYRFLFATQMN